MNALWQSVLGEIELSVSHATFTTWYKHTELVSQDEEELVISVPNIFAKKQFEVKFNDQIKNILAKNGVNPKQINYTVNISGKRTRLNRETTQDLSTNTEADNLLPTANSNTRSTPQLTGGLNPRYT